jgi:hypothetical protein
MSNCDFCGLIMEAKELGATMIDVFGYGEPLMDPRFVDKITMCSQLGLDTFTTTNAALLTLDMSWALVDAGLKHIRFSVHAVTSEKYPKVHRGLDWTTVKTNIENFIQINEMSGCPVTIHVTSIPMNGENLDKILKFWNGRRCVDYLEVWRPHNWTNGRNYRVVHPRKKTCGRPFNGPVQIQADGKMVACCFDFDGKLELGDTNLYSIQEILEESVALYGIQESHNTGHYGALLCGDCDQRNIEDESPLLYSTRDERCELGRTSTGKFRVQSAEL